MTAPRRNALRRPGSTLAVLVAVALGSSACGGGGDGGGGDAAVDGLAVQEVRACLERAGFEVERATDERLDDGVTATLVGDDPGDVTFAAAGHGTSAKRAADVRADADAAAGDVTDDGGAALELDSGLDGTYVWAVGGESESAPLDDARACVEPG